MASSGSCRGNIISEALTQSVRHDTTAVRSLIAVGSSKTVPMFSLRFLASAMASASLIAFLSKYHLDDYAQQFWINGAKSVEDLININFNYLIKGLMLPTLMQRRLLRALG